MMIIIINIIIIYISAEHWVACWTLLGGLTSPFPPSNFGEGWATAGTEKGYPEPFVLLEPPAQNPGCSCVVG